MSTIDKDTADSQFRTAHEIITRKYYVEKSISKAEFDAQHKATIDTHDVALSEAKAESGTFQRLYAEVLDETWRISVLFFVDRTIDEKEYKAQIVKCGAAFVDKCTGIKFVPRVLTEKEKAWAVEFSVDVYKHFFDGEIDYCAKKRVEFVEFLRGIV